VLRLVAAVTVAVAVLAATASGSPPAARIGVTCVGASGWAHGGQVKPAGVMLACGDANYWIAALEWRGWGTATARAAGRVHYNDCTPYCAAGHFHTIPGTASLSNLKAGECKGAPARFYTRLHVAPARRGKDVPSPVDETLPAHC
jgi:hypothetical protein